jgi:hypothetical protein
MCLLLGAQLRPAEIGQKRSPDDLPLLERFKAEAFPMLEVDSPSLGQAALYLKE